jgi:hypothetical protein
VTTETDLLDEPGPWRVIPGMTPKKRPYWMIGRDEGPGIRFQIVEYSCAPRRWYSEPAARNALSLLVREQRRAKREAAERAAIPLWPFPLRGRNIEDIRP